MNRSPSRGALPGQYYTKESAARLYGALPYHLANAASEAGAAVKSQVEIDENESMIINSMLIGGF